MARCDVSWPEPGHACGERCHDRTPHRRDPRLLAREHCPTHPRRTPGPRSQHRARRNDAPLPPPAGARDSGLLQQRARSPSWEPWSQSSPPTTNQWRRPTTPTRHAIDRPLHLDSDTDDAPPRSGLTGGLLDDIDVDALRPLDSFTGGDAIVPTAPSRLESLRRPGSSGTHPPSGMSTSSTPHRTARSARRSTWRPLPNRHVLRPDAGHRVAPRRSMVWSGKRLPFLETIRTSST